MKHMKQNYVIPLCEVILPLWETVLCESPELGGSEDIGYEDWVIN